MNRQVILSCPIEERCIVSLDDNHWQSPRIGQDSVDHVKDFAVDEAECIPVRWGLPASLVSSGTNLSSDPFLGRARNRKVLIAIWPGRWAEFSIGAVVLNLFEIIEIAFAWKQTDIGQ
jgi:hypothetical protein